MLLLVALSATIAQEWQTDFEKAKKMASQDGKAIILVFQGSDWCAPCMKLDREIWSSEEFIVYAKEHYVMVKADFPRRKQNKLTENQEKANAALAEKYNKQGIFPFVAVLDAEGKILGKTGYKKITPKEYINSLNQFLK